MFLYFMQWCIRKVICQQPQQTGYSSFLCSLPIFRRISVSVSFICTFFTTFVCVCVCLGNKFNCIMDIGLKQTLNLVKCRYLPHLGHILFPPSSNWAVVWMWLACLHGCYHCLFSAQLVHQLPTIYATRRSYLRRQDQAIDHLWNQMSMILLCLQGRIVLCSPHNIKGAGDSGTWNPSLLGGCVFITLCDENGLVPRAMMCIHPTV